MGFGGDPELFLEKFYVPKIYPKFEKYWEIVELQVKERQRETTPVKNYYIENTLG